jgi:Tfp pilus assembly protein PilW
MECKTTSTNRRVGAAFTLVEVLVASGLAVVVLSAFAMLSLFSGRSFVAMANYVNLDQTSQLALDKMSREIRQARQLTSYSPTNLTFADADDNPLQFTYDPASGTLVQISGGQTNTLLTGCDSLKFSTYQGTAISNTFDAYDPAYVTNSRLIQITWTCSRAILGAKANSESVQSAKVTLRNH